MAEAQFAQASADEPFYFVTDLVKHPSDLAVEALVHGHTQTGRSDLLHVGELGAFAIKENPAAQFLGEGRIPKLAQGDFVFFFDLEARMSEPLREIAVAGEEEQPFTLSIEATDVEEAGKLRRQQIVDRVGGVGIAPGRNKPCRLMQDNGQDRFWPD